MAGKFFDKMLGAVGFDIVDDTEENEEEYEFTGTKTEEPKANNDVIQEPKLKKKGSNVVNLHTQRQLKVIICKPTTFFEAQEIADLLKMRRQIILNLEITDKELAKKLVDFLSGAVYALDGTVKKVGEGIFLFAPDNIEVFEGERQDNKNKDIYSWIN